MTNETKKATRPVFRVNYTYVTTENQIRPGAFAIEADNAKEAQREALDSLARTQFRHYRITSIKEY